MNARFQPSSHSQAVAATALSGPAGQACCCVARAVVRVVMPPAPGRPHETELLLCGHHFRVSRDALSAAHARVETLAANSGDAAVWFRDDQDRSAHTAVAAGRRPGHEQDAGPGGAGFRP